MIILFLCSWYEKNHGVYRNIYDHINEMEICNFLFKRFCCDRYYFLWWTSCCFVLCSHQSIMIHFIGIFLVEHSIRNSSRGIYMKYKSCTFSLDESTFAANNDLHAIFGEIVIHVVNGWHKPDVCICVWTEVAWYDWCTLTVGCNFVNQNVCSNLMRLKWKRNLEIVELN